MEDSERKKYRSSAAGGNAVCVGGPLHGQSYSTLGPVEKLSAKGGERYDEEFRYKKGLFQWDHTPLIAWIPENVTEQTVINMFGSGYLRRLIEKPAYPVETLPRPAWENEDPEAA